MMYLVSARVIGHDPRSEPIVTWTVHRFLNQVELSQSTLEGQLRVVQGFVGRL